MKNTICCFLKVILTSAILWLPAYGQVAAARPLAGQPLTRASLSLAAPLAVTAMLSDPCSPKNPKPGFTCLLFGSTESVGAVFTISGSGWLAQQAILQIVSPKGTIVYQTKLICSGCGKPDQKSLLVRLSKKAQKGAAPFFIKDNKIEIVVTTKEPVESATIEVVAEEKK